VSVPDKDIMEVALDLFAEKGYASVSTREIAQKAGITEMTLFRKFQTKRNLFSRILLETWDADLTRKALEGISIEKPRAAFQRCLEVLYKVFRSQKRMTKVLANSPEVRDAELMAVTDGRLRILIREIRDFLDRVFKRASEMSDQPARGAFEDFDPSLLSLHVVAHLLGLFFLEDVIKMESAIPWETLMGDLASKIDKSWPC